MDKKTNRTKISLHDVMANRFYQLPKFLFDPEFKGLSNDARVLYALLRDRHELSIKNGWVDEEGYVYLIFKREDMEKLLGVSDKTVIKAINNLKKYNLIEEQRLGQGRANRIYLLAVTHDSLENTLTRRISGSRNGDSPGQETEILRPNDNDSSTNDSSDTNINQSTESFTADKTDKPEDPDRLIDDDSEKINKIINDNCLSAAKQWGEPYNKWVDSVKTVITQMYYDEFSSINGKKIPQNQIREKLSMLTPDIITEAIDRVLTKSREQKINHPYPYLRSVLYNEIEQHEVNTELKINYDLEGGALYYDQTHQPDTSDSRQATDPPDYNAGNIAEKQPLAGILERYKDTEFGVPLKAIQNELSQVSFQAWFDTIQSICRENDTVVIKTHNKQAKDMLSSRYIKIIDEEFQKLGVEKVIITT